MNILGEGFPEEITKQVEQRQKVYGSGYTSSTLRSSQEIVYLNANTSWCKLVSSVDITNPSVIQDESLRKLGNTIKDDKLAKQFILFNGVNNNKTEGNNQRAGITDTNSILGKNNAYGIGGTEFGIRPMMGIKSARIKHENRGSIRRATLQIKAFNRSQFDIIDVLYLRLGFDVLLEWGHSMYYQNNGTFVPNPVDNSLADNFLTPTTTYDGFLDLIQEKRLKTNGNYDAMFAKVVNFHWSFLKDGSYDITLDLVSVGDVVESFKINLLAKDANYSSNTVTTAPDFSSLNDQEVIAYFANKNSIGEYFYKLQTGIIGAGTFMGPFVSPYLDFLDVQFNGLMGDKSYYIRLGTLLKFFEDDLMYRVINKKGDKTPMLKFNYDMDSNIMHIDNDKQISVDPTICLINRTLNIAGTSYTFTPSTAYPFDHPDIDEYGRIMNIYVNIRWILIKLDELKNANDNKVVLIDFLNNILSNINGTLGGINKLEVTIDETKNTVVIRDMNPFPKINDVITKLNNKGYKVSDKYTRFDLYGYNETNGKGHASFIKDFSFKTEISPELSTMLTIGATANSTVVGENSTALSKFNIGLQDRWKTQVSLATDDFSNNITATTDIYKKLLNDYAYSVVRYDEYLKRISANNNYNFQIGEGDVWKEAVVNFNNYLFQAKQVKQNIDNEIKAKNNQKPIYYASPGTGFIPFNMSLTMDGLSGMKIYSKFFIDVDFLPANYPDSAEFLIKSIEHTIEDNKWFTTLESIVISKGDESDNTISHKGKARGENTNKTPTSTSPSQSTLLTDTAETELYYDTILKKLGAPKTNGNILFLKAWRQAEGGKATWNAFNTTIRKPGSTNYNSIGVQNYTSLDQGAQASADTLLKSGNGIYYKNIVASLKKGIKTQQEAQLLAAKLQQLKQDLFIWVRGPGGKDPLPNYVAAVLKGKVGEGKIYKSA